jgi:hypothetical protein
MDVVALPIEVRSGRLRTGLRARYDDGGGGLAHRRVVNAVAQAT